MRILVLSDSHGHFYELMKIIDRHRDINKIIFLGDGERDFDLLKKEKEILMVKGNCDFGSQLRTIELDRIEDNLIMACHGHTFEVKYSNSLLLRRAGELGVRLALYGHTHVQSLEYTDGIYLFNPGAVANGQYGIADITKDGIVISEMIID
ncbi:MAG: YfcE family phosphodiesterase [Clostridia bacterium]|nr:YfcE family phosphodiesterase [Clostridia bacterium]